MRLLHFGDIDLFAVVPVGSLMRGEQSYMAVLRRHVDDDEGLHNTWQRVAKGQVRVRHLETSRVIVEHVLHLGSHVQATVVGLDDGPSGRLALTRAVL